MDNKQETWGRGIRHLCGTEKQGRSIALGKETSWGLIWRSPEKVSVKKEGERLV